ncbi:hypothetical protein BJ741DRAFT_222586 [Chytriomyces cf. hyalinus JEL632]|nr:hypothetical protein BJ741DRAFT_222586 [Chytriomyces cf. hyalinus JEL632]
MKHATIIALAYISSATTTTLATPIGLGLNFGIGFNTGTADSAALNPWIGAPGGVINSPAVDLTKSFGISIDIFQELTGALVGAVSLGQDVVLSLFQGLASIGPNMDIIPAVCGLALKNNVPVASLLTISRGLLTKLPINSPSYGVIQSICTVPESSYLLYLVSTIPTYSTATMTSTSSVTTTSTTIKTTITTTTTTTTTTTPATTSKTTTTSSSSTIPSSAIMFPSTIYAISTSSSSTTVSASKSSSATSLPIGILKSGAGANVAAIHAFVIGLGVWFMV